VVEFHGQEIDLPERLDEVKIPTSQVGQISDGSSGLNQTSGNIKSEPESSPIIMAKCQRPNPQPGA